MKFLFGFILCLYFSLNIFAQCDEPLPSNTGQSAASANFLVSAKSLQSEQILTITAATARASWETKGAESAVLTIFVNGRYNQDVMLFAGAEKFTYRVLLGKFNIGKHKVEAFLNKERSAQNVGQTTISAFRIDSAAPESAADRTALKNAPLLYLRPDTIDKFSDIPLLTYYEILPANDEKAYKIRYTTIFTNEDGGTQTAALMARWGRATDIEYVYEIDAKGGAIKTEIIQGANHEIKNFGGKRVFGVHPVIYDATVNNNFADSGCSKLRTMLLPVRADLSRKSRETVMDENSWTYRLMAQEMQRENRINPENLGENTIADLRDYAYAEVSSEPQNAAITVETKNADGKILSSDDGKPILRVNRPGFVRIALRMPKEMRGKFPTEMALGCYPTAKKDGQESVCKNLNLIKIVRLDEDFRPLELKLSENPKTIKGGEKAKFKIPTK